MAPKALRNTVCIIGGILLLFLFSSNLFAVESRIKDITNIRGVRNNQLIGFGLVVGLSATGDSANSLATNEAVGKMLTRLGAGFNAGAPSSQNIAAVIVTADLPPFARIGDRIDVKVSAVGDAASLAGGTLVMTPLRAGDSQIYAVAQGQLVTGQATGNGNRVLTVARMPNGGVVEREFEPDIAKDGFITLSLRNSDFTTNSHITERINQHFKGFFAKSLDPSTIEVELPPLYQHDMVSFVSELENLKVKVDVKAKVVMNERTGTIVMGADVKISDIAVAHGNLAIQVGATEDAPARQESVGQVKGSTVGDLVESLNALGMKPNDLIGVLQALHAAGALQAELQIL